MSEKKLEFKDFTINEYKEDGDSLTIKGYGAVFDNIDAYGDVIKKGAFAKTLKDMAGRIAFCYQHDIWNPIGKINVLKEDAKGLYIEVVISEAEDDIKTKIKEGILKEMSIGFRTINATYETLNGTEVRNLTELKLFEVSLVTIAANPLAIIEGMKSEIERKDYIEQEFDRIIAIEKSHNKQFELLKLKALVCNKPTENVTIKDEPLQKTVSIEEAKAIIEQSFKRITL